MGPDPGKLAPVQFRGRPGLRLCSLVLLGLLLGACGVAQTPYLKDGKPYGVTRGAFRDKWWNHYERGLSFAEGGFSEEAMRDLGEAARRRGDDQWRARTYGMHFLDYFPHRELGILHYRQKNHEDAIRELETSLNTAPSAKAAYFLNRARAALLEQTGRDRRPPAHQLDQPADQTITNAFYTTISGVATDDEFVSSVSVNGAPLLLERSVPRFPFETRIPLEEGPQQIRVRATDLVGRETSGAVALTVDRRGPSISVAAPARSGAKVRLSGYITDDTGIVRYSINGRTVDTDPEQEIALAEELAPGPVRIEAVDRAGNVTIAEISPVQKAGLPARWPRFASLDIMATGSQATHRARSRGVPLLANVLGLFDNTPPTIALRDLPASRETFHDRILIEGSASDTGSVASLAVNGTKVLRRGGTRVFFSHLLGLAVGENRIEVEAVDAHGNTRTRELIVDRKVPEIRQLGSRMSIAMLTLDHRGSTSISGGAVNDRLVSAFVSQKRFNIVERERIQAVLAELELGATQLADPASAPRIGHILAADTVLAGSVLETDHSIEVVTHLIDTESSAVLATNDAYDEARSLSAVHTLTERLAFKYRRDFPILEGRIIDVSGREVMVDLGSRDGLRPHRKLIVFRAAPAPDHPAPAGLSQGQPLILGEANVREVFADHTNASVTRRDEEFRALDGVITK